MKAEAPIRTLTPSRLSRDLRALGVTAGMTLLVHAALSRVGHVLGGTQAVIESLLEVLGRRGTLMMPTHSSELSEPSYWRHPPAEPDTWEAIRAEMPAWDPERTRSRAMGALAEHFRRWPGVRRSNHPQTSFAAIGPASAELLGSHRLGDALGETSPIGALNRLDGHVLLLGVGHGNNTSLHLAEYRARWPGKCFHEEGAPLMAGGVRRWQCFTELKFDDDDFEAIGAAWEAEPTRAENALRIGQVGAAESRLLRQQPLVDFATAWMTATRA